MTVLRMSGLGLLLFAMTCYLELIEHQDKTQSIPMVFSEAALYDLGEAGKPGVCPEESPV